MYQYRANVEFDIDGLKDFYIDDLMEQELNIYLMVECWIRDYIDINDMYIRMVEDGHEILEWESFLPSELSYRSLFVASNYKLGYKNQCIDYLYARFKQVVKGELIRNSLIDRLEIERVYLLQNSMQILLNCNFNIDFEKFVERWMAICSTEYHPVYHIKHYNPEAIIEIQEKRNQIENIDQYYDVIRTYGLYGMNQKKRLVAVDMLSEVEKGDYIWMRDNGIYYLGRVNEDSNFTYNCDKDALDFDAANQITGLVMKVRCQEQ